MGVWTNSDGLTIVFGTDEATKAQGGDYEDFSFGDQVVDFALDLTTLTSSADETINYPQPMYLPVNTVLQRVDIITEVAVTTGTSATLDIGIYDQTTASSVSTTAIVSALAQSTIATAGTVTSITTGVTGAGTKMGLVMKAWTSGAPDQIYVTARTGTGTFTAGKVRVRLFLYKSNVLENLGVEASGTSSLD